MIITLLSHFADSLSIAPLPKVTPGPSTIETVLHVVFVILGAISLLVITIAGLRFIISRGDAQRVKQAREAILYAIVGLIVAASGYAIVGFVLNNA